MKLTNEITVPAPIDDAWELMLDVERVAPCLPGASIEGSEGDEYKGSMKVKIGPIVSNFNGTLKIEEANEEARRAVMSAKARDARGKGSANATISSTLEPAGEGTKVTVETDLRVTGPAASFGRGVMQDVSAMLMTQFADCLATKLGREEPGEDRGRRRPGRPRRGRVRGGRARGACAGASGRRAEATRGGDAGERARQERAATAGGRGRRARPRGGRPRGAGAPGGRAGRRPARAARAPGPVTPEEQVTDSAAAIPVTRSNLREQIQDVLLQRIVEGTYQPGERIVETRIAQELGVSQGPVREALRDLEQLGCVVHEPGRGCSVREFSAEELLEAFPVRAALEALAARLAAERITRAELAELERLLERMRAAARSGDAHEQSQANASFHATIVRATRNETLERQWRMLEPYSRTYLTVSRPGIDLLHLSDRHEPVLDALRRGDPEAAAEAMHEHLMGAAELLTEEGE